jgi:hypothetical protein
MIAFAAAVLVLLAAFSFADAGNIKLSWQHSTGATGYRVYTSASSGDYTYGAGSAGWEGTGLLASVDGLANGCTQLYAVVTAFNSAGESGPSNEVPFTSRPIIDDIPDPGPAHWLIPGDNFTADVVVYLSTVADPTTWLEVTAAQRQDCQNITIPVTQMPGAPEYFEIKICTQAEAVCQTSTLLKPPEQVEKS